MSKFVTITKASGYLHVTPKTLRRWEKMGLITPVRSKLNHRLYNQSDLNALLHQKGKPLPNPNRTDSDLSISQAADLLEISVKTLRRWEKEGKISCRRNQQGQRVFSKHTVIDLIRKRNRNPLSTISPHFRFRPTFAPSLIAGLIVAYISGIAVHPQLPSNPAQDITIYPITNSVTNKPILTYSNTIPTDNLQLTNPIVDATSQNQSFSIPNPNPIPTIDQNVAKYNNQNNNDAIYNIEYHSQIITSSNNQPPITDPQSFPNSLPLNINQSPNIQPPSFTPSTNDLHNAGNLIP